MKVLLFSWEYPPHIDGGLGQHVKELTPALLEADPNLVLHIVTPTFAGDVYKRQAHSRPRLAAAHPAQAGLRLVAVTSGRSGALAAISDNGAGAV